MQPRDPCLPWYSGPSRMICSYSGPSRTICGIQWALTDDLQLEWALTDDLQLQRALTDDLHPRCSPRGNPACRGTFGGRRKAVREQRWSLSWAEKMEGHQPLKKGLKILHGPLTAHAPSSLFPGHLYASSRGPCRAATSLGFWVYKRAPGDAPLARGARWHLGALG